MLIVISFVSVFKKNKMFNLDRGFTLIELLVVMAIIGVLATLLILQLGTARAKARDSKRIADVTQMRSALEQSFDANNTYPTTGALLGTALTTYLAKVPSDPLSTGAYCYAKSGTTSYVVWTQLEQYNANALGGDSDVNETAYTKAGVAVDGTTSNATGLIGAGTAAGCSVVVSFAANEANPCPAIGAGTNTCAFDLGQ